MKHVMFMWALSAVLLAAGADVCPAEGRESLVEASESYDAEAAGAFSRALKQQRGSHRPSPEMAAARRRLDRAVQAVKDQAAAEFKGKRLREITSKLEQSGEQGRATAASLERQIGAIRGAPSPREFEALTNSIGRASSSLGVEDMPDEVFWEMQKLDARVRNAVEKELAETLRRLESSRPVKPIGRRP
jgi:hypothetical protein